MSITLTITSAGRTALINAQNTGTAPVTIASCGISASDFAETPATAALPGEIKRINALSGDVVADETIHLIVRDETTDAYSVRSIALYLASGVLFAVYSQPAPIVEKTAATMMLLAIDIRFADIDAQALTFGNANWLNPPATETVQGVAEIATQSESDAGTDDSRIVTPKKNRASFLSWAASLFADVWRASNDGAGSGLDADLLDGQQGSWYSNIIARLGFTPVNRAGDTISGSLAVAGPTFFSNDPAFYLVRDGDRPILNFDASDWLLFDRSDNMFEVAIGGQYVFRGRSGGAFDISGSLQIGGHIGWHAGNDGAGSGLDADLLDGRHASAFLTRDVDGWKDSVEGAPRLYFALNSTTYFGSGGGSGWIWQYQGTDRASLDPVGNFYARTVSAGKDGAVARLDASGDILARRANGIEGVVYLGPSGRYLHFDGTHYHMPNADLFVAGGRVWTTVNDGGGSGLDADLLDGQDGSWYSNIIARLGFTPVNRAGDTITGNLSIAGTTFFTNDGGFSAYKSGGNPVNAYDNGDYFQFSRLANVFEWVIDNVLAFAVRPGGIVDVPALLRIGGQTSWHAGNDGSGSGLDADLLDGRHASDFMLASAISSGSSGNGYWRRSPDGNGGFIIEQWGRVATSGSEATYYVPFPIAFTDPLSVSISLTGKLRTIDDDIFPVVSGDPTSAGFSVHQNGTTADEKSNGFHWRAIGR